MNLTKNNIEWSSELENSTLNEVMNILNLSEKSQEDFYEKYWDIKNTDLIEKILKEDKQYRENKELAKYAVRFISAEKFKNFPPLFNDTEIVKIAVTASNLNYYYISDSLKKDISIAEAMIQSLMNEWSNFNNITNFINDKFWEDKKKKEKLEKFYNKILKKSENFIHKDIENSLFILSRDFPQYIEQLVSDKILTKQKNSFIFTDEFYKNISDKTDDIWSNISDKERKILIKNIILESLQIPNYIPNKYINFLVNTIEKNISIKKQTKNTEKKPQDNKSRESTDDKNISDNPNNSDNYDLIMENNLDYWYPECSYIYSSGSYLVSVIWDKTVDISEQDMEKFTSVALKNFIKFYALLYDIWLGFLWDKYKTDFSTLCNNKTWFDYQRGEWITEWKSLSILNIIGKSIGVPENTSTQLSDDNKSWEENNKIKTPKCFNTLADAKMQFWDIKSSWKINGYEVMEPGTFSNYGVVEKYMLEQDLIDTKWGGLNLSKFG